MKFISETSIITFDFSPIQEEISIDNDNGEWSPNQGFEFSTIDDDSIIISDFELLNVLLRIICHFTSQYNQTFTPYVMTI